MRKTLAALNDLENQGIWSRYAIGGAVAALFYIEPFQTEDLDILVLLRPEDKDGLAPLSKIYEALRNKGFVEDGPYVIVEGVPVQFLPAYSPLVEEAVFQAKEVSYEDVWTRVLSAEHLAAIMLETGRQKDRARFEMMRSQAELDGEQLAALADRYGLRERLNSWTSE